MDWRQTLKELIFEIFDFTGSYARDAAKIVFYSFAYVSPLVLPIIFFPKYIQEFTAVWILGFVPISIYVLSVAQHVSEDERGVSMRKKILGAIFPGLNKMLFSVLVVSIIFLTVIALSGGLD